MGAERWCCVCPLGAYPRCGHLCGGWERRVRQRGVTIVVLRLSLTPRWAMAPDLPPIFYLPTCLDPCQREWAVCYLWEEMRLAVLGEKWLEGSMRNLILAIDPDTAA